MNTKLILLVFVIALFLISNSILVSCSELWWNLNYSSRQYVTVEQIESLKYGRIPQTFLTMVPEKCYFEDCRDLVPVIGKEPIPHKMIDVDGDDIPEYDFVLYSSNISDFETMDLVIGKNRPRITYNDSTIVNWWEICYQMKNNDFLRCDWKDDFEDYVKYDNIEFGIDIFSVNLKDRLDLYTIINFTTDKSIKQFCPFVLNLGKWPKTEFIFSLDSYKEGNKIIKNITSVYHKPIKSFQESANFSSIPILDQNNNTYREDVYRGLLIFIGENKSAVITKPMLDRLRPHNEYFFRIDILDNEDVVAYVCTEEHEGYFLPPNGPKAYIFFGENDIYEIIHMGLILEYSPPANLSVPEFIESKFIEGIVSPIGEMTYPEIRPRIKFEAEEAIVPFIMFKWSPEKNKTIDMNSDLVFEENVRLNGSPFFYPFDVYEATIHVNPGVIVETISDLSFGLDDNVEGIVNFKNDKIIFSIYRKSNQKIIFLVINVFNFIVFILCFKSIKNMKRSSFQPKKMLEFIASIWLLVDNLFLNLNLTIGFVLGIILILILIILLIKKYIILGQSGFTTSSLKRS